MDSNLLSQRLVEQYRNSFGCELVTPGSAGFDRARSIWNGMIDRKPALIVRCQSREDVAAAVKLARAEELPLSVRGGGHGVAGTAVCQDGVMIDLSLMKGLAVDADRREMVAAPGVLWGEFDVAAGVHGLATTGGQVSHTGIAGLTLGGGLGYLMGKYGAVCDNLLSVEMVTADGEFLTASEDENPDLFWAVRGAGANFGVATQFRYRLHPLPEVVAGLLLHTRDRAAELIAFHRKFSATSPDELDTTLAFLNGPDGTPLVGMVVVYAGGAKEAEEVLRPLRAFGPPIADMVQPMPYAQAQQLVDALVPTGNRYYWKSNFVDVLSDELGEKLKRGADAMSSPYSAILLFEIKGAIRRVPKDAMAFDHRDPHFEMSILANWTDPAQDSANVGWARELWTEVQPLVASTVYANHLSSDESVERVRTAYGDAKFRRLSELKAKYDPGNLFRMNHNIPPA